MSATINSMFGALIGFGIGAAILCVFWRITDGAWFVPKLMLVLWLLAALAMTAVVIA